MPPLILVPPLDALDLIALDLTGLLQHLRNVTMTLDAANLGHVLEALDEGLVVLEGLSVPGRLDALALRGVGAPEADVAVVGAGEDVLGIGRPAGGHDALHALGVVDVAGVAAVAVPEAHGAVPRRRDELLARGAELDVHDGGDVVLEDVEGAGELAHVEDVDVVVLGRGGEVEGLHGVPRDAVAGELQRRLGHGRRGAEVVDDDGAVVGARGEHRRLDVVEGDVGDGVDRRGPVEDFGRRRVSLEIVDGDDARRSRKGVSGAVMR